MRPSATKVVVLAVLFAAGVLLAAGVGSGQIGETTTTTTTTTAPATTMISTETVRQTTTRRVIVPATTTSTSDEGNGTPAWVWALVGILAVGLVVLVILLARRPGTPAPPPAGQQRRLDGAVATWAAQGWALESQTADSAVLRRGNERMLVSVDPAGNVTTRDLPSY
jgi:hypothetical protein